MRNKKLFKNWSMLIAVVAIIAVSNLFIVTEVTGVTYSGQHSMFDYEPMVIPSE